MPRSGVHGDEVWVKCPFCGDSPKPNNVHFSVNITTRLYHCFRCSESGKLSVDQFIELTGVLPGLLSIETRRDDILDLPILKGPGSSRPSGLDRHHVHYRGGDWDVFLSRTPTGKLVGLSMRSGKDSRSYGVRALGYAGASLDGSWVRLVEGPYDIIDPEHDVCTFGFPTRAQLKHLRAYQVVLCPDGDVWLSERKLAAYFAPLLDTTIPIIAIEIIPNGKDPDEVPPSDRQVLEGKHLMRFLKARSKARKHYRERLIRG